MKFVFVLDLAEELSAYCLLHKIQHNNSLLGISHFITPQEGFLIKFIMLPIGTIVRDVHNKKNNMMDGRYTYTSSLI